MNNMACYVSLLCKDDLLVIELELESGHTLSANDACIIVVLFLSLYPTVTGRMEYWVMETLPRTIGNHSL